MKKKQKQELKQVSKEEVEFKEDIEKCKTLEFEGTVKSKWLQGQIILKNRSNKRRQEWARALSFGIGEIDRMVKFAKDYPEYSHVMRVFKGKNWYEISKELWEHKPKSPIVPLPEGKYNIIYADPPWKYWEGGDKNQEQHYDTLEFSDIRDRIGEEVKKISADNCILFLWITDPMLDKIDEIVKAWGFEYSTVGFYWVKKTENDRWFFGLGNWTRANPEICIIATKGSIERKDASISKLIISEIDEHSKKPTIVRDKIIQLVGDIPRIELFARPTGHPSEKGWVFWGNETKENGRS